MPYTVKSVADMAGVTVRTLHHYDRIGLLRPASVSPSGYRLYSEADLERLQQILFFRELGFGLGEIKTIMDNPGFDRREALVAQKRLLLEKQRRIERLIASIETSIDAMERGTELDKDKMFGGFDESKIKEYTEEARARWGNENVDESIRRSSKYTKAEWAEIMSEGQSYTVGIAALMDRDPGDPEVQKLIERHFRLINDRFYTVTPEIFRGLGDLYVSDPRFTAFYDKVKPGLAQFMKAAMHAYCDRVFGK